jgi:hypothetical protein
MLAAPTKSRILGMISTFSVKAVETCPRLLSALGRGSRMMH